MAENTENQTKEPQGISSDPLLAEFEKIAHNDAIVHHGRRAEMSEKEIIVLMARRHEEMMEKMAKLEMIVPKVVKLANGETYIWRAPESLLFSS